MDDAFVNTWYDIRAEVEDNVLNATPFTLALKQFGCLKAQAGGEFGWTDTIRYGTPSTQRFQGGSTLTQTPVKLDTFARLDWRYYCIDVNRSFTDDMKNQGPNQIKSYLTARMEQARNALVQDTETYLFQWGAYSAAPLQINGLWDIVAPYAALSTSGDGASSDSVASGTSNGGIDRSANTWWRNWVSYDDATQADATYVAGPTNEPYSLNLVADMEHLWNCIDGGQEAPNLIITCQNLFETYGDEVRDKQQVVRTSFNKTAADLGFETLTFRGAAMIWSRKMTDKHMVMLNMNYVDWNYHPNAWMDMTDWKDTANQLERVAYIVCMTPGLATGQPRRHGHMLYAS
jgi:hypothetical protein